MNTNINIQNMMQHWQGPISLTTIPANKNKWSSGDCAKLQMLADDLPVKPYKRMRIIKANKTTLPYENVMQWIVSNGHINEKHTFKGQGPLLDKFDVLHIISKSENNINQMSGRSFTIPADLIGENKSNTISIWEENPDNTNLTWKGLFSHNLQAGPSATSSELTYTIIANHYNMNNGGVVSHISYLRTDKSRKV